MPRSQCGVDDFHRSRHVSSDHHGPTHVDPGEVEPQSDDVAHRPGFGLSAHVWNGLNLMGWPRPSSFGPVVAGMGGYSYMRQSCSFDCYWSESELAKAMSSVRPNQWLASPLLPPRTRLSALSAEQEGKPVPARFTTLIVKRRTNVVSLITIQHRKFSRRTRRVLTTALRNFCLRPR